MQVNVMDRMVDRPHRYVATAICPIGKNEGECAALADRIFEYEAAAASALVDHLASDATLRSSSRGWWARSRACQIVPTGAGRPRRRVGSRASFGKHAAACPSAALSSTRTAVGAHRGR